MSYDLERPQSRTEEYLAFIAQLKSEYPDKPLSRVEAYLEYIAEHGGGGGADPATRAMIAADYDATKTYAVGDFAIYNNKLYKALEETTGEFVPAAWEETSIDNELKNVAAVWGNITGDMDDQTDLKNKFDYVEGEIGNLKNIGRFLAIWDASAGCPTTEPQTTPYAYRTGDYYRIGVAGNKVPTGSEYHPGEYDLSEDETGIGDVWYYDGNEWAKQASSGGGTVQDVLVAGTSVLSEGIANIPTATSSIFGATAVDGSTIGLTMTNKLKIIAPSNEQIESKSSTGTAITTEKLDKAVMEGLGNNSLTWSDAYKAAARTTIGIKPETSFTCEMADGTTKTLKLYSELV